jgi:mannan endo-1,4-beta-mannosidase
VKPWRIATIGTALAAAAAIIVVAGRHDQSAATHSASPPPAALRITLPAEPGTYLGTYAPGVPRSYTNVTEFTKATGVRPNVVVYYSGWGEPFQIGFAKQVAKHGAVPVVQIQPTGIDLSAIATGRYDTYLASYARAVLAYGHPVIMSFGHEMNGTWYSWSNGNSSPKAFVAAWRRIVMDFRTVGAENVTWLWTVNVIDPQAGIPDPRAWWPGSSYVTWVGIDGYYTSPKVRFVSLFGPTIVAIRTLTNDPILIAETGAAGAHQPASITDLFAGIRSYQILGLIWFDADTRKDWQLTSAPAIAAFRLGAAAYPRAGS